MLQGAPNPAIVDAVSKWPAILRRNEAMRGALERSRREIMEAAARGPVPPHVEAAFKSAEDQLKFTEAHTEEMRRMLMQAVRDALNAGDIPRTEIPKLRALGIMPQSLSGMGRLGARLRALGAVDDVAAWHVAESYGGSGSGGLVLSASNVVGQQAGGGESGLGVLQFIELGILLGIAAWSTIAFVEMVAVNLRLADESQARIAAQAAIIAEWKRDPTRVITAPPIVVPAPSRGPLVSMNAGGAAAGLGVGGLLLAAAAAYFLLRRKGR